MQSGDPVKNVDVSSDSDSANSISGAPAISLPRGGGAVRGLGEKFAANPVTGTGSLTIAIATSPGRSGFGPQLSLSYDSGAGSGPFGLGWRLSTPNISRKTDKGLPRYFDAADSDEFILSGSEDLVPVNNDDRREGEVLALRTVAGNSYQIQRYRPRIESLFARIEQWTNPDDPSDRFWRSISRDNITTWYGRTSESRIFDPGDPTRIFSWLICESHDDKGNVMVFRYKEEDTTDVDLTQLHERNRTDRGRSANRYLKRVRFGNRLPYFPTLLETQPWSSPPGADTSDGSIDWHFETVFDYGEHDADSPTPADIGNWSIRRDPFSSYRAGFECRTYRLCQRILMFHHFPDEINDPNAADAVNGFGVGASCLVNSTDLEYHYEQDPNNARNPIHSLLISATQCAYKRLSQNRYRKRTLPSVKFEYSQAKIQDEVHDIDPDSVENLPQGLDGALYRWVDLDGEGLSGLLTEQGKSWLYKRNLSPVGVQAESGQKTTKARFAPLERVTEIPSLSAISNGRQQLLDLAGDGQLDLAEFDSPTPGFFERTHDEGWNPFKPFESLPVLNWSDPNLKFVDLTGDGHADILITEHKAFCWHPSLAEAGFGPPEC